MTAGWHSHRGGKVVPGQNATSRDQSRGFTLLELLVVLVIIGVMASYAVLQFGDRGSDLVDEESTRLKMLIRVAREEAILQSREYGLGFSKNSYAFYAEDEESEDNAWNPVQGDPALRQRQVPEELKFSLVLESQLLELKKELPEKPQIFIFSSGEMTPFSVSFRIEEYDSDPIELKFDELGRTQNPDQP